MQVVMHHNNYKALINQTLSTAFINITNGGVRPDIVSIM